MPQSAALFLPEIILVGTAVTLVALDLVLLGHPKRQRYLTGFALVGLALVGYFVWACGKGTAVSIFSGQIAIDPMATLFKLLFLGVTAVSLIAARMSAELPKKHMGEYYALLVAITFGLFLMASANDFLMAYLGIEMVSILSYALAGYRLRDRRSSEAALKYVIYGGAASGMMLFGISLIYGMFGSTEFTTIHRAMVAWDSDALRAAMIGGGNTFPLTLILSLVLVFAGVGYKIAVVPFHMWAPDVYEGAPTPFTGFLSVGPKAAGFALLMRMFVTMMVDPGQGSSPGFANTDGMMAMAVDLPLPALLGIIAAATMTFGNLAAIAQNNVKRLLAYSSIAHAGYLLMGFVVLSEQALHAVILYLIFYYLMNLGAFIVCQAVRDRTGGELMHDFRGLGTVEPMLAIFMTIFLLSLTGLPPLAGFIGKFYLFSAVIERGGSWYIILAIIGVVNSAISLFYYLNVSKAMWFCKPTGKLAAPGIGLRGYTFLAGALGIPTLILGLYWAPVTQMVHNSIVIYRSHAATPVALHVNNSKGNSVSSKP